MDFEDILERVFDPIFLACANFIMFGLVLCYGILNTNAVISYSSTGFFIAGASIGVLAVIGRWIWGQPNPEQSIEPTQYIIKGGAKDGIQAGKNKVLTTIEI